MSDGFLERVLCTGEDGTALSNSTTPTSILPSSRKFTLPSYFFDKVGKALKVRAAGRISTVVTTPGTLTLDLKLGSIVVASSGAMTLNTTAQTNVGWLLEWELICRSIGAGTAATLLAQGYWRSHAVIGAPAPTAGGAAAHVLPYNAAPAVGNGFDATAAQTVDLFATWSVANASNSIQLHQFALDLFT
jgi:hypothetical protein